MSKFSIMLSVILVVATLACSKVKPEPEMIADIQKLEQTENLGEAITQIESFIKHYPESENTPNFTAKLADLYILANKDYQKAIQIHREIVEKYPGTKLQVRSQFMIGYIYANELKDYENARIAYEQFLEKFPNDELAPSVRWEIQNLGVDISQIPIAADQHENEKGANKK